MQSLKVSGSCRGVVDLPNLAFVNGSVSLGGDSVNISIPALNTIAGLLTIGSACTGTLNVWIAGSPLTLGGLAVLVAPSCDVGTIAIDNLARVGSNQDPAVSVSSGGSIQSLTIAGPAVQVLGALTIDVPEDGVLHSFVLTGLATLAGALSVGVEGEGQLFSAVVAAVDWLVLPSLSVRAPSDEDDAEAAFLVLTGIGGVAGKVDLTGCDSTVSIDGLAVTGDGMLACSQVTAD